MLSPPKVRTLDQPVTISLEALISPDHFYRDLDATLDLSFVRDWVADCYAERGYRRLIRLRASHPSLAQQTPVR